MSGLCQYCSICEDAQLALRSDGDYDSRNEDLIEQFYKMCSVDQTNCLQYKEFLEEESLESRGLDI